MPHNQSAHTTDNHKQKYSNYLSHSDSQHGHSHDDHNHNNLDNHRHKDGHSHDHGQSFACGFDRNANGRALMWCLIITFVFSMVEGLGGYYTKSIALQSEAIHMLTDAAGLLIAYIANQISKRPATVSLTFGYGNMEAVGALINCIFTIILTLGLIFEVVQRFFVPVDVHGIGVFVLGLVALCVNGLLVFILSRMSGSLNIRAALLHALGDLLGAGVAVFAGLVIYFTGVSIVDPILSLVIICLLLNSNYKLIKKSLRVLLAGVPDGLDYVQIGLDLEKVKGVDGVHDLHIWYMSANKVALSAHIIATDLYTWQDSLLQCQKMLSQKHGIEHITLQYEFSPEHLHMKYCDSK